MVFYHQHPVMLRRLDPSRLLILLEHVHQEQPTFLKTCRAKKNISVQNQIISRTNIYQIYNIICFY